MVIHHDQIPSPAKKKKNKGKGPRKKDEKKVYSEVFFLSFPQWFLFDTNPCLLRLEPEEERRYNLPDPIFKRLDVLAHHGNHEIEETHGLDEGETQNGVGEELATQSRVAGDTHEESGEDETDTDTGTTETDGSGTHTQVLGDLDHGVGDFRGVLAAGLLGSESLASVGLDEAGGRLTLDGLEGGHGDGLALGGEGTLGGKLEASGRASDLGGSSHGGGQALGEDTGGGHCDGLWWF
jgi:hypothetical protein